MTLLVSFSTYIFISELGETPIKSVHIIVNIYTPNWGTIVQNCTPKYFSGKIVPQNIVPQNIQDIKLSQNDIFAYRITGGDNNAMLILTEVICQGSSINTPSLFTVWQKRRGVEQIRPEKIGPADPNILGILYQMRTFSYLNLHLQSSKSKNFRACSGLYLPAPPPQPQTTRPQISFCYHTI